VQLPLNPQVKDRFEAGAGNNTSGKAALIKLTGGQAQATGLTIHNAGDLDWYRFKASAAGTATVTLSAVSGGLIGHLGWYESSKGSLADENPAKHATLYGPKQVEDAPSADQIVTMTVSGLKAGHTYYIKVSGDSSTTGLYTLGISIV
jgi:hypothetical protein